MNILVIGNADSVFVKNYVQHILLGNGHDITIVSTSNSIFYNFYAKHGIPIFLIPAHGIFPLRTVKVCLSTWRTLHKMKIDIIHIHLVTIDALAINRMLKKKGSKSIASFWGSDLFRVPNILVKINKIFLKYIDMITLSTNTMRERFQHDYGKSFKGKLCDVKFGNSEFDLIDLYRKRNIDTLREELNLPKDRYIFAIGYNKRVEQQHLKVLEQIAFLPESLQKQIHIIMRLTYGDAPDDYMDKLRHVLKDLACSHSIYTSLLSDVKIAQLELATDVFIHAQTTDAFSASVQEYIYAGKLVINPKWIQYQEMHAANIFFLEYSNFLELRKYIISILENKINYAHKLQDNPSKIYAISSWKAVSRNWHELIM